MPDRTSRPIRLTLSYSLQGVGCDRRWCIAPPVVGL
jgi:hypothetical protein